MAAARTHTAGDSSGTEGHGDEEVPPGFRRAVAELDTPPHRPEIHFATLPAPRRLAPFAHALEAQVTDGEEEHADGRFILLHDPRGQESWLGTFRIVTLGRTVLEPEMATDPLLPEVTWSWLTGALEAGGVEYGAASGTVTRSGSYFFGELADRQSRTDLEIRASWTPMGAERADGAPDVAPHLAAWAELLCQCAGLPPADGDDGSVVSLPQRRGPRTR